MSRCYRVSLKESLSRTVCASDEMAHKVELTEGVLDAEQMKDSLRKALEEEGWDKNEEGNYTLESEGETLTWDIEESVVTASIEEDRSFEKDVLVSGSGGSDRQAASDAQRKLKQEKTRVDKAAEDVKTRLRKDITKTLSDNEDGRKKKLNRVVRKAYSDALGKKASSLGSVVSSEEHEDGDEYSLTIQIEA